MVVLSSTPARSTTMSRPTPMMEQYQRIKSENADAILMFRMGDFYEMFNDDAKVASRVLGLALTTRDKGSKNPIPLAGVPHHALESYLARLVAAGYRVAVCDQVEDPAQAKGLVKREVTEIITPGTILSTSMLDERRSNYLVSLVPGRKSVGVAKIDLSTGEFSVTEIEAGDLRREVMRSDPSEILVPEDEAQNEPLASLLREVEGVPVTRLADWEFGLDTAAEVLRRHFNVVNLDGFGISDLDHAVRAAGGAMAYLKDLKKRKLSQITSVRRSRSAEFMVLDETTQRNLELVEPLERGLAKATLLAVLDRTVTPMGARLLRRWILYPLLDLARIERRLDAVQRFVERRTESDALVSEMAGLCDMERVIGRVASAQAGPRELAALRRSIEALPSIASRLGETGGAAAELAASIPDIADVAELIAGAIADDPPAGLRDGGVIRDGHDARLDELRAIARDGKAWIGRLQATEREATGITSLKIGYNKVFGYYVEVTRPHLDLVPERYQRKQTLVNAERFVTPELKEYESKILTAEEDMARLEREIFERVRGEVGLATARVQKAASVIARIDALLSLSVVAAANDYVRPSVDDSTVVRVSRGRHPVVERLLEGESFVPNDAALDSESDQIILITGPNMAGKSTYLRQVALIVVMAQMGSFVPADSARVGLVDRIFTRIGATDALARGRSTFLVEMGETAEILNNATGRSLILLDEVGRGTSTFDGLSIAWAVTEYLHNREHVHPRTFFATHYHELTELADVLPRLTNMNVLVKKTSDSIVFLRKVVPGFADQSYGIEVARLAGIPEEVILRAREILDNLEDVQYTADAVPRLAGGEHGPLAPGRSQLGLFDGGPSEVEREIADMDLDTTTPLGALEKLAELKKRVRNG